MENKIGDNRRGFTLLEVLLFLALFGTISAAILQFLSHLTGRWLTDQTTMARRAEFAHFIQVLEVDVKWPGATVRTLTPDVVLVQRDSNDLLGRQPTIVYCRDGNCNVHRLVLQECGDDREILSRLEDSRGKPLTDKSTEFDEQPPSTILMRRVDSFRLDLGKDRWGESFLQLGTKFHDLPLERSVRFYLDEI